MDAANGQLVNVWIENGEIDRHDMMAIVVHGKLEM